MYSKISQFTTIYQFWPPNKAHPRPVTRHRDYFVMSLCEEDVNKIPAAPKALHNDKTNTVIESVYKYLWTNNRTTTFFEISAAYVDQAGSHI